MLVEYSEVTHKEAHLWSKHSIALNEYTLFVALLLSYVMSQDVHAMAFCLLIFNIHKGVLNHLQS